MAFIIKQPDERIINRADRILDREVNGLHQRPPIFISAEQTVLPVEKFMSQASVLILDENIPVIA